METKVVTLTTTTTSTSTTKKLPKVPPVDSGVERVLAELAQARDKILPEWERVQDWYLTFGVDNKERHFFGNKSEVVVVQDIELRELQRNRDGRYLYEKILALAPVNLFRDPNYYVLQYRLPGAPFSINVSLGNNVSPSAF